MSFASLLPTWTNAFKMSSASTRTDTRVWPTRWTPPSPSWLVIRHPHSKYKHSNIHTHHTHIHTVQHKHTRSAAATDTYTLHSETNKYVCTRDVMIFINILCKFIYDFQ